MYNKLKNIIKQAFYKSVDADTTAYPRGEAQYNGKLTKFTRMSVYGIESNPPKDSHILLLSSQGQESNKFGFINDFLNRSKGRLSGEVAIRNTVTGTTILLKTDGTIDITNASDINITTGNINITGGDIDITGGDVTADDISLKTHFHQGNLSFPTGAPIQSGGGTTPTSLPTADASGIITDGTGISSSAHTHTQGNDSGGNVEQDTGGPA